MKIERIRIKSFKSYADSDWVNLSPKFTVLVGQNSSGKSAFLQALDVHNFNPKPHRSPKQPASAQPPESTVYLDVKVEGAEILDRALNRATFNLPTTHEVGLQAEQLFLSGPKRYEFHLKNSMEFSVADSPIYGEFTRSKLVNLTLTIDPINRAITNRVVAQYAGEIKDDIRDVLLSALRESTFLFRAERYAIGQSAMTPNERLRPDANNLAYMLSALSKHRKKFLHYEALVKEVLPSVQGVSVAPAGNLLEISIHSHGSMRGDLAIPLNECGTGVGQVLAILYVVVEYESAVLVIDEPNSFLHPSASRRLLGVLKRFDQHQYILSTHSPEVLAAIRPDTLLLLRWDEKDGETKIIQDSVDNIDHLTASLTELGAGLSDVFGFDVVVFVEGPTEAACFPLLVPATAGANVNFVAMREASSLMRKRNADELFAIYTKGVSGSALLAPKTRFSFDRDGRSNNEIQDIVRASKSTAHFLPLPMIENYFLHPGAISALVQSLDGGAKPENTSEEIQQHLDENFKKFSIKDLPNESLLTCDAARLLADLVSKVTENRFEYRKIEHGRQLTLWLFENDPQKLNALRSYVSTVLS